MSWLKNVIPPKIKRIVGSVSKKNIPEGLWCKCPSCQAVLYRTDLEQNMEVCPKCSFHNRISARSRIDTLLDKDKRKEIGALIQPLDSLKFNDTQSYADRIKSSQKDLNEKDAMVVMQGLMEGKPVVIAAFEFKFMGGSMGSVVGEKFVRGIQSAIKAKATFICVSASGGARMQEGLLSLMQMAKTSAALTKLSEAKLPYFSVLTDPTMGGVSASFAMLGDVIIAEPKALIGFAGPRVIRETIGRDLPEGFQTSEFIQEKGFVDFIVKRTEIKETVSKTVKLLMNK